MVVNDHVSRLMHVCLLSGAWHLLQKKLDMRRQKKTFRGSRHFSRAPCSATAGKDFPGGTCLTFFVIPSILAFADAAFVEPVCLQVELVKVVAGRGLIIVEVPQQHLAILWAWRIGGCVLLPQEDC